MATALEIARLFEAEASTADFAGSKTSFPDIVYVLYGFARDVGEYECARLRKRIVSDCGRRIWLQRCEHQPALLPELHAADGFVDARAASLRKLASHCR